MSEEIDPRELLLAAFSTAVDAVQGRACVTRHLQHHPLDTAPVVLLAMGKAAMSMAHGAVEALGSQLVSGLVVTRVGYADDINLPATIEILEAGHPVPNQQSLDAGNRVVALLDNMAPEAQLLILLSGGASALVEVLPEGMELEELVKLSHWLLASGLPIDEMNRIRQSVSLSKGGKLAQRLRNQVTALVISDVPGDDLAMIGSGPFYFTPETATTGSSKVPDWIASFQERARTEINALAARSQPRDIPHHLVATNRLACEAVLALADARDLPAMIHASPLAGEAEEQALDIVAELEQVSTGLHIWGGETTVTLPQNPGRGGRNQQLALAAANAIAGSRNIWLLAVGTDGSDGNSDDTGALVDGQTRYRGETEGLDIETCLQQADAGTFLQASGDLIYTGPTGTNVMDLVLAYKGN